MLDKSTLHNLSLFLSDDAQPELFSSSSQTMLHIFRLQEDCCFLQRTRREEKESTGVGKAVYGYVIAEGITGIKRSLTPFLYLSIVLDLDVEATENISPFFND